MRKMVNENEISRIFPDERRILLIIGWAETRDLPFELTTIFADFGSKHDLFICEDPFSLFYLHYNYICVSDYESEYSQPFRSDAPLKLTRVPNEILPGLFLGEAPKGDTLRYCEKMKLTHILNCTTDVDYPVPLHIKTMRLSLEDSPRCFIHFGPAVSFLDAALPLGLLQGERKEREKYGKRLRRSMFRRRKRWLLRLKERMQKEEEEMKMSAKLAEEEEDKKKKREK
eukprot:MONOS_5192.1-p1 / transcript=MONOS_5192.1 / gene=MONOS_5192 / organism=Monocercomonoides_exilis_PA203 / gene_product=unspecified product / transcript_product=unspecified product / location=Mono_scaffold00148:74777-75532(-) / protein_length=228 / sequence_SO=supercontig / SO=protein_coding / is_pseudo=false